MYSWITRERGRGKRRVKADVRDDFEVLGLSKQADSGATYRVAVVSSYVSLKPPNTRVKLGRMSPLEHTLLFSSMFHCPFPSFLHFQTLDIVQDSKPMFYFLHLPAEILSSIHNAFCTSITTCIPFHLGFVLLILVY